MPQQFDVLDDGQCTWHNVSPDCVPQPGVPVVIRLNDRKLIAGTDDGTSVLRRGQPYGFQIAVLRYVTDGFGVRHPDRFVSLRFDAGKHRLDTDYALNEVAAWLDLFYFPVHTMEE